MKIALIATAAATFLTAGTAHALPPAPAVAATTAAAAAPAAPSNKKLCMYDETTGSRIKLKTCRTAAQWDALGVTYEVKR